MSNLAGILAIDKPRGMTSHDVVNRVRRLSGTRRVGHAGTLDPLATGLLLLCLGRATRLVEYLIGKEKAYEAEVRLGQATNTYDAEGEIVAERPVAHLTTAAIETALVAFRGDIDQRPPMFSAVKQDGQPLYKLARRGQEVARSLRQVTISQLTLDAWHPPQLQLSVTCSSGTYIRSLAHDLGEALNCGGHITGLRRVRIGSIPLHTAVPLADLTTENLPAYLQTMDTAVSHLPRIDAAPLQVEDIRHGRTILREAGHPEAELVRVYEPSGRFLGVLMAAEETWRPKKIFHPE